MAMPVAFLPHRFRSAAPHYVAGRPPYPARLIARVAALTVLQRAGLQRAGLPRGGRVLDLGCGPGQLALAFSGFAAEVLAVDPEPEMLRVARGAAGGAPIRFLQGSSYDLGPPFGRFDLAVMGRSFHWMDRAETLRRLDRLIEPGGAVALFGDTHPELPDNAWRPVWRGVLELYRDPANDHPGRGPGWVPHEAVLLDSAFSRLDRVAAIERRHIPVVTLVERALSRSSHSPSSLGERVEMLSQEVVRALEPFIHDGMITEVVETYALIATRREAA
jgi:SAM-dependent methyltransferase